MLILIWICSVTDVDTYRAFLFGMKNPFRLHSNLGAYQRVISVAIRTVVAACVENVVKSITSGDDKIELMPTTRPGMSPGHFVTWFVLEDCVSDRQSMMAAEFNKYLSIFVQNIGQLYVL